VELDGELLPPDNRHPEIGLDQSQQYIIPLPNAADPFFEQRSPAYPFMLYSSVGLPEPTCLFRVLAMSAVQS